MVAGESVAAGVDVVNLAGRRLLPTVLELPVGVARHRYGIPMLAPGAAHEETFTIRTERRGVIFVVRPPPAAGTRCRSSVAT